MSELPREYTLLFNAITDADRALIRLHEALIAAQQAAEELVMETGTKAEKAEEVN